jgi:hypothetical protein
MAVCGASGFVAHPPMNIANPFWLSQNPFPPHLAGEVNLSSQGIFQSHGARHGPMRVGITTPGQAKKTIEKQPQTASLRRTYWDQSTV